MALREGQVKAAATGDDEVHDRPGEGEARGLAREATDDLRPSPNFIQRPLQQDRRGQPPLEPERIGEVDGERCKVVGETGGGRWVLAAELADEDPQRGLGLGRRRGSVEGGPVGGPDPVVEPRPLRQLGQDVPEAMDRAALAVGVGPQLADRPIRPGAPSLTTRSGHRRPRRRRPWPRSSQSSTRSRWPRQTSSRTCSPWTVKPQATRTLSLGPSGRTGR